MNTKEFVAMQMAQPFSKRRIPDSLFIRNNSFRRILQDLAEGQQPETAGLCFDNAFIYEPYERYIGSFHSLYPNVIITEKECREHH